MSLTRVLPVVLEALVNATMTRIPVSRLLRYTWTVSQQLKVAPFLHRVSKVG